MPTTVQENNILYPFVKYSSCWNCKKFDKKTYTCNSSGHVSNIPYFSISCLGPRQKISEYDWYDIVDKFMELVGIHIATNDILKHLEYLKKRSLGFSYPNEELYNFYMNVIKRTMNNSPRIKYDFMLKYLIRKYRQLYLKRTK